MGNGAFTILPMSQRFSLEAGGVYEGSIKIVNPADATENFSYKASVSPYGVVGNDYAADLTTMTGRSEIAKWITIEEPVGEVEPNTTKEIKFTIRVPENAPAGGQYATIAVSSNASSQSSSGVAVQNIFEMASIVYANVSGETVHKGEVLENNIPGFVTTVPIRLSALVSNEGNTHEDATFLIAVSDFFTGRVILPTEEDNGHYSELIMPETTRNVEREINNLPSIGIMKVSQTIYYNGEVYIAEKKVVICPIWFMILLLATIIAIIATIVSLVVKHKKRKKRQKIAV